MAKSEIDLGAKADGKGLTDEEIDKLRIGGAMGRGAAFLYELLRGEEVLCVACKKGHYRPFNPAFKINHSFICDNCGDRVHWDSVMDFDLRKA